jgi:hypothetical protein
MKVNLARLRLMVLVSLAWSYLWGGCSTVEVGPLPVLPPKPPEYVRVVHPEGLDIADLKAVFLDGSAFQRESLKECTSPILKLRKKTTYKQDIDQAAKELVRSDPVKYHWCFYATLLDLEEQLMNDLYFDERQRHILDAFHFIAPVSRAFLTEYHDSRYLRWAISRYRRMSEYVFYRRLDVTPEVTADLANASNPLGLVRPPKESGGSILERYGLSRGTSNVTPEIPSEPVLPAEPIATAPLDLSPTPSRSPFVPANGERFPASEPVEPSVAPSPIASPSPVASSTQ